MRRSLPACLLDGRTRFTRALAVPERSPCAGVSRSLPDGRTGFTRAPVCASLPASAGDCLTSRGKCISLPLASLRGRPLPGCLPNTIALYQGDG